METTGEWELFLGAAGHADLPEGGEFDREMHLIRAAAGGDEDAFRRLVEDYQDRVYRTAYQWLGSVEDAQEVCQDTFVRAYQALGRFERRGKFSTWLYKIAINLCRDRAKSRAFRTRAVTTTWEQEENASYSGGMSPDELLLQKEALHHIGEGISRLPEKLRSAVVLAVFEGLSQEECGRILGCSVRAVEGRLRRARQLLSDRRTKGD